MNLYTIAADLRMMATLYCSGSLEKGARLFQLADEVEQEQYSAAARAPLAQEEK